MKNYIFGYARVSTQDQSLNRQLDALKKYGVDEIYCEKMTGTKRDRPELGKLLERMTKGDTIIIESLSRISRSTKDLISLMETFSQRGINIVSLKESIDTSTSTGRLLFNLVSCLAQFERDNIVERTREGLLSARARGRLGGRPKANEENVSRALKLYQSKQYTLKEIEAMTSVKKSTLFKYKNLSE